MIVRASHYTDYKGPWGYGNFTPRELADRHTGLLVVDTDFLDWLQAVRDLYGFPMNISSGTRTPEHQMIKSGRRTGAHVDGMAVDVLVYGERALRLVRIVSGMGVLGLGVSQTGPIETRYLHLDRWTKAPPGTRPGLWSYAN